jgi:tRNA modification GTPase
MDLSQAEAVADLIAAETAAQARIAQEQLQGKLRDAVLKLGEPLRDFLAEVEAYIDFPEEDISPLAYSEWLAAVQRVEGEIQGYLSTFRTGRLVREGASVVLLGLPNAGKSSLLNALLGEERAIVTAIPGTTRDTIQEVISLDGMPVRLWDTAGIREGSDEVERLGIERSWKQVDLADLVVFVVEGGAKEEENQKLLREVEQLGRPTLIALNKADLSPALPSFLTASHAPMLTISARTGQGLSELKAAIVQHLTTGAPPSGGLVISHLRHFESLQSASAALVEAVTALEAHHPAEFVALSIRLALSALDDIIGVTSTDEILGRIFSKFCIGK